MASTSEYLTFVMDQLSELEDVRYRSMMGEYLLWYRDKLFGGIYDDRLLVKDIPAARHRLGDAALEEPYPGAKPMLLVEQVDEADVLCALVQDMEPELPKGKKEKRSV
jgi:TfoX/Sxy family transcriptional regulator of competence genes